MLPVDVGSVANNKQAPANFPSHVSSTTPSGADRLLGAVVCSGEAAFWMLGAFLWFAFWGFKLTLMVGIAVLRIRLK